MTTWRMTRKQFISILAKLLKETYPDVTEEIVAQQLDQIQAGGKPTTIIGMSVQNNLKRITVV